MAGTTNLTVNATSVKPGVIFRTDRAVAIDRIEFWCSAVTGTPVFDVRLETVSTNVPSGSLVAAGANLSGVTPSVGWNSVSLTTPYTPSVGDQLTAILVPSTADGSNSAIINFSSAIRVQTIGTYPLNGSTLSNRAPHICPRYSDGLYCANTYPIEGVDFSTDLSSATTPDEMAQVWVADGAHTVGGVYAMIASNSGATRTVEFVLYDNGVEVRSVLINHLVRTASGTLGVLFCSFASDYVLTPGNTYRIAIRPVDGVCRVCRVDVPNADALLACLGESAYYSERTNAGSWSDDSSRLVAITPYYTALASGGGASEHSFISIG